MRRYRQGNEQKTLSIDLSPHHSSTEEMATMINRYRSGLEQDIAKYLRNNKVPFTYEVEKLTYTVPSSKHTYTPDFCIITQSGKQIYIEGKGIWAYDDRYKHLLIRQQYPGLDIRFVFSNSRSKIRKGSKTTYRDICEGRGRGQFRGVTWQYSDKKIPKVWLEE